MMNTRAQDPAAVAAEAEPADRPDTEPHPHSPARWLRPLASAALLGILFFQVDLGGLAEVVKGTRGDFLIAALGALVLERLYGAYRWHVLLKVHRPTLAYGPVLRILFITNFYGMFLPGGGIEVLRVAGITRSTSDGALAVGSVLMDRLLGLVSLLITALAGCALAGVRIPEGLTGPTWIALGACLVLGVVLLNAAARSGTARLLPRALRSWIRKRIEKLVAYFDTLRGRPALMAWAVLLAFGIQSLRVLTVYLAALALGIDVPVVYFFAYVPLIVIAQLLPIGVGGLGVREAAFVYFFGTLAVPAEQALALSLLIYVATLVSTLPGAFLCAPAPSGDRG